MKGLKGMFENKTEKEAKEEILKMVEEYCNKYHKNKKLKRETEFAMQQEFMIAKKW